MAIENRPKIAKSSFAASVPLSKMLKLGKVIVPEVDIATLLLEEFSFDLYNITSRLELPDENTGFFYNRGRIIRLDELSSVVRLERRTTEDSSSRRIIRLVAVFTLETNNQTNKEYLPKFDQTDNTSSSKKNGHCWLKAHIHPKYFAPRARQM